MQVYGDQSLNLLLQQLSNQYSKSIRVLTAMFLIECVYCNEDAQDYLCEQLFEFTPVDGLVFLNQSQISQTLPIKSKETYQEFKSYCSNLIDKYNQEKEKGFYRKYWSYPEFKNKKRTVQSNACVGGQGEILQESQDSDDDVDDVDDVEIDCDQDNNNDNLSFPDPLEHLIGFYVYSKDVKEQAKYSQATESLTGSIRKDLNNHQNEGTRQIQNKGEEYSSMQQNLIFTAAGSGSESSTNIQKRMKLQPKLDSLSPQRSVHNPSTSTTYQSYFSRNNMPSHDPQHSATEKAIKVNTKLGISKKTLIPKKYGSNNLMDGGHGLNQEQTISSINSINQQYFTLNVKTPMNGNKKLSINNLSSQNNKKAGPSVSSSERQHFSSADHQHERERSSSNNQNAQSSYPSFLNSQHSKVQKILKDSGANIKQPTQIGIKQTQVSMLNVHHLEEEQKSVCSNKETFIGNTSTNPPLQTPTKQMNFGSINLSNFPSSILNSNSMKNKNMLTLKNIISKTYKVERKIDIDPGSPKTSSSNTQSMVSSSLMGGSSLSTKSSTAQQITFKTKLGIGQLVKPRTKVQLIKKSS